MLQCGALTGGRRQLSAVCMSTQEIQEHQRGQTVHDAERPCMNLHSVKRLLDE